MAVYLGFMVLPIACLLPGVRVEVLLCVCFSDVLGKKEFLCRGKKGGVWFFKAQIPLSKNYRFPVVP